MFKSDSFPLGPNGSFPKQRINSFGNEIEAAQDAQDTYLGNVHAKLPNREHDFHGSNEAVKHRFKHGKHLGEKNVDKYRPRYAPKSNLRGYEDEEDENLGFFKMWRKRKKPMPTQSQSEEAHAENAKRKEAHRQWLEKRKAWQQAQQPAMTSAIEPSKEPMMTHDMGMRQKYVDTTPVKQIGPNELIRQGPPSFAKAFGFRRNVKK